MPENGSPNRPDNPNKSFAKDMKDDVANEDLADKVETDVEVGIARNDPASSVSATTDPADAKALAVDEAEAEDESFARDFKEDVKQVVVEAGDVVRAGGEVVDDIADEAVDVAEKLAEEAEDFAEAVVKIGKRGAGEVKDRLAALEDFVERLLTHLRQTVGSTPEGEKD